MTTDGRRFTLGYRYNADGSPSELVKIQNPALRRLIERVGPSFRFAHANATKNAVKTGQLLLKNAGKMGSTSIPTGQED
ncbi:MAG: hypothetical protein MJE77_02900 [Proteobacteria bacterium]|nr:hypothetical protein [Pseudomonadota bacterium]